MGDKENYYFRIHSKTSNSSMWHTVHTLEDVYRFLQDREDNMGHGDELTITRQYGWDEEEKKELARLKKKYEPVEEQS